MTYDVICIDCEDKLKLEDLEGHLYAHGVEPPWEKQARAQREVLEAIRGSKSFGMLSHQLQDRVHGVLRR